MKKMVLSAKLDFLHNYANNQFKDAKGLHLNSSDWKTFIHVKNADYYSFIQNGTIVFNTESAISGENYTQPVKLKNFKKLEPLILLMFLCKISENEIKHFLSLFLSVDHVRTFCQCKAFQFWGPHYNLTKIGSAYGPGELRPPIIRDPKQKNYVCKHLWMVLNNYNSHINEFSSGILPYYRRFFGINSPTGVDRLRKMLGIKGVKKVIEQAIIDLNKLGDANLTSLFNSLTRESMNNIYDFFDATKKQAMKKFVKETPSSIEEAKDNEGVLPSEEIQKADYLPDEIEKIEPVAKKEEIEKETKETTEIKPQQDTHEIKPQDLDEFINFDDDDIQEMIDNAGALSKKVITKKRVI